MISYRVILSILLIDVIFINCDIETVNHQNQNSISDDIVCGQASSLFENCFRNYSSKSLDIWNLKTVPLTTEEVNTRCLIFNQGMKCFYAYTDKCVDPQHKHLIQSEVSGAQTFHNMLCKDKKFRRDYLKHRDCYRYIQQDWNTCTLNFNHILHEEMMRSAEESSVDLNIQYMHFCCTRLAYEKCVYKSAKLKCKKESALFTRKIVEILSSERQFNNCRKIQDYICSAGSSIRLKDIFLNFFITFVFSGIQLKILLLR